MGIIGATNEFRSSMSSKASRSKKSVPVYGSGGKNKELFPAGNWTLLSLGAIRWILPCFGLSP